MARLTHEQLQQMYSGQTSVPGSIPTSSTPTATAGGKVRMTTEELRQKYQVPSPEQTMARPETLGSRLGGRMEQFGRAFTENKYPGQPIIGGLGAVAGGINDVIGTVLEPVFRGVVDKISDVPLVQKFAGSKPVSEGLDVTNAGLKQVGEAWKGFEEQNPTGGQFLRDVGNIASLVPTGKVGSLGLPIAKKTAKNVAGAVLPSPEGIMNRVARLTPTQANGFKQIAKESHGNYLQRTGNFGTPEQIVTREAEKFAMSLDEVDRGLASIPGLHKSSYIDMVLDDLVAREARIGVPSPETNEIVALARKHRATGLTMEEANQAKRLYERNVKLGYAKENNTEGIARATRLDTALREWQFDVARKNGFKNLDELNKQTQISRYIVDKLGRQISGKTGNEAINLTDWIILANGDPTAIAAFLIKKGVSSKGVQAGVAKMLAGKPVEPIKARFGGKSGLPALIEGRDYRTTMEMPGPKAPNTMEAQAPRMNRSDSLAPQLRLSAPKSTAQGVTLRLPKSIRETNIGMDETRGIKTPQTNRRNLLPPKSGGGTLGKSLDNDTPGFRSTEVAVTSFRGKSVKTIGETRPLMESTRFKGFVNRLGNSQKEFGIRVKNIRRVAGSWEGSIEPSLSAKITGKIKDKIAWAVDNAKRMNQDAVILFTRGSGKGFRYSFKGVQNPDEALALLHKRGISGATVDGNDIRVYDIDNSLSKQIDEFSREIGIEPTRAGGTVRLIFKSDYGKYVRGGRGRGDGGGVRTKDATGIDAKETNLPNLNGKVKKAGELGKKKDSIDPKQFDTAEDFVKASGKVAYHTTPNAEAIEKSGFSTDRKFKKDTPFIGDDFVQGTYFSPTKGAYKDGGTLDVGLPILEVRIPKNLKFEHFNGKDLMDYVEFQVKRKRLPPTPAYHEETVRLTTESLKKLGLDGITLDGEIIVFDPSKVKTKTQLTNEWKNARGVGKVNEVVKPQYKQFGSQLRKQIKRDLLSDKTKAVVIDSDTIKKKHPDFDSDKPNVLHEESSALSKELFKEAIDQDSTGIFRMTGGGAGSGKSEAVLKRIKSQPSVIFDGVLANPTSAIEKIDYALSKGKRVEVYPVYAPIELATTFNRMRKRRVPSDEFVKGHFGFRETIPQLIEKYGKKIKVKPYQNAGFGVKPQKLSQKRWEAKEIVNARKMSLDEIKKKNDYINELIDEKGVDWTKEHINDILKKIYGEA